VKLTHKPGHLAHRQAETVQPRHRQDATHRDLAADDLVEKAPQLRPMPAYRVVVDKQSLRRNTGRPEQLDLTVQGLGR
jgi:hypothetical protein